MILKLVYDFFQKIINITKIEEKNLNSENTFISSPLKVEETKVPSEFKFSYYKHHFQPYWFHSKIHMILQKWPKWKSAIKLFKNLHFNDFKEPFMWLDTETRAHTQHRIQNQKPRTKLLVLRDCRMQRFYLRKDFIHAKILFAQRFFPIRSSTQHMASQNICLCFS